jgi:hypothetical protein
LTSFFSRRSHQADQPVAVQAHLQNSPNQGRVAKVGLSGGLRRQYSPAQQSIAILSQEAGADIVAVAQIRDDDPASYFPAQKQPV